VHCGRVATAKQLPKDVKPLAPSAIQITEKVHGTD